MFIGDAREIRKNTFSLYARAAIAVAAHLIATPVVLRELGTTGYGMYCAVAGVVATVFFVEGALFQTSRRFLSCELSDGEDRDVSAAFAAAVGLTLCVCAVLAVLGETLGRWFVSAHLSLPRESADCAPLLCHLLVAANVMRLMVVPFDARVFASERMGFFWKVSILESLALVSAALALTVVPSNRVVAYAAFCCLIGFMRLVVGMTYCRIRYDDVRLLLPRIDVGRMGHQFVFFLWSMFYDVANILKYSGASVLVNVYAGVRYSASWSVSNQVGAMMCGMALNFHNACFPGVVKLWASNDNIRFRAFTGWSFRISAVMSLAVSVPLFAFAERILGLWLGSDLPPEVVVFTRCMIIHYFFEALAGPLTTAIVATGRIARYQFWMVTFATAGFFLAWVVLACGLPAWTCVVAVALMNLLAVLYRVHFAVRNLGFGLTDFIPRGEGGA